MLIPRRLLPAIALSLVLILSLLVNAGVGGTSPSSPVAAKSTSGGVWLPAPSDPATSFPQLLRGGSIVLQSGRVLLFGSDSDATAADLYDPATGALSPTGRMQTGRRDPGAALLSDGRVLVSGGIADDTGNYSASSEVYDPTTGSWSATGSMLAARYGHTAVTLNDGRVLVTSGFATTMFGVTTAAELYDPATGSWSSAGTTPTEHGEGMAATILPDGRVLVTGGLATRSGKDVRAVATADVYDPTSNTWSRTADMSTIRFNHAATLLRTGKVLVAGGRPGLFIFSDNPCPNSAELYDPSAGTWSATGSMTYCHFSTARLPDGRVLTGIGSQPEAVARTVNVSEIYEPATGTWSPDASMFETCSGRLLLRPGGEIIVFCSTAGAAAPRAERYVLNPVRLFGPAILVGTVAPALSPGQWQGFLPDWEGSMRQSVPIAVCANIERSAGRAM